MSNLAPSERPFRFFDLPRELRDMVYLSLTRDKDTFNLDDGRTGIGMMARNTGLPAMLRVTRQFSIECQDTLKKHAELCLFDRCRTPILAPVLSRDLCKHFSRGSIYLRVHGLADLRVHISWIQGLQASLHNFSRLHVVVFICPQVHLGLYEPVLWPHDFDLLRDSVKSYTLLAEITPLLQVSTITSVEVRFVKRALGLEKSRAAVDPEYYNASASYGCWDKIHGWTAPNATVQS